MYLKLIFTKLKIKIFFTIVNRFFSPFKKLKFITRRFNKLSSFYSQQELDTYIAKISNKIMLDLKFLTTIEPCKPNNTVIFLATTFYEHGGHTTWQIRIHDLIKNQFPIKIFITNSLKKIKSEIPDKMLYLKTNIFEYHAFDSEDFYKIIIDLIKINPKVIICNYHPNDAQAASITHVLKKLLNTKIIYFNHADHMPNYGHLFADKIICYRKLPVNISNESINKVEQIPLPTDESDNIFERPKDIPNDSVIGFSGGSAMKIFSEDSNSNFLNNVFKILLEHKNYFHIFFFSFSEKQKKFFYKILEKYKSQDITIEYRFIIKETSAEYKNYLQNSDLFLDSYPMCGPTMLLEALEVGLPSPIWLNASKFVILCKSIMPKIGLEVESEGEYMKIYEKLILDADYRALQKEKTKSYYKDNYSNEIIKDKIKKLINE